jgi:hypothetical protein
MNRPSTSHVTKLYRFIPVTGKYARAECYDVFFIQTSSVDILFVSSRQFLRWGNRIILWRFEISLN